MYMREIEPIMKEKDKSKTYLNFNGKKLQSDTEESNSSDKELSGQDQAELEKKLAKYHY